MGRAPGEVGRGVTASVTLSQVCKVSPGSAFIPPSIWDRLEPAVPARCWEPSADEYGRSRERERENTERDKDYRKEEEKEGRAEEKEREEREGEEKEEEQNTLLVRVSDPNSSAPHWCGS